MEKLLEIRELKTCFNTEEGLVRAVDGVSFEIGRGEMVGVVGESGSGKSVTALSVMRLLFGSSGKIEAGQILWNDRDLVSLKEKEMMTIRGNRIGMIFQEPMTSLNPVLRVGSQVEEVLAIHSGLSRRARRERAAELFDLVGIPDARRRLDDYPHQMSGGMRQRVMIAMSLACNPELLIADEPTTALDVTIQAQILELLAELQRKLGMGVIFITHNLGIVARMAHQVVVMYAGKVVEKAPTRELFRNPSHPYTIGLLESIPKLNLRKEERSALATIPGMVPSPLDYPQGCRFSPRCPLAGAECRTAVPGVFELKEGHTVMCDLYGGRKRPPSALALREAYCSGDFLPFAAARRGEEILAVSKLTKQFHVSGKDREKRVLTAVKDVCFSVAEGETLGIVGESGCGKTTVGKMVMGLEKPTGGSVVYRGEPIESARGQARRDLCRKIQMVFQDPFSSLNPRMTVREIISEGRVIHGLPRGRDRIAEALEEVGLQPDYMDRYPHEFSGGQRQRIGIARALAVNPELLVCDEPVSALDVSVQAQVINLFQRLQADRGLTYLFIAHDLSVVRHIADRVLVMYLGQIMETGPVDALFENPFHPYTEALLSAIPEIESVECGKRPLILLPGDLPSPYSPPQGCLFSTRCPRKISEVCDQKRPPLKDLGEGRFCACWLRC